MKLLELLLSLPIFKPAKEKRVQPVLRLLKILIFRIKISRKTLEIKSDLKPSIIRVIVRHNLNFEVMLFETIEESAEEITPGIHIVPGPKARNVLRD
jgi:hypothetical protein